MRAHVGGYGDHKIDEKRHDLHMNNRRFDFRPVTEGGFAEGVPDIRQTVSAYLRTYQDMLLKRQSDGPDAAEAEGVAASLLRAHVLDARRCHQHLGVTAYLRIWHGMLLQEEVGRG
jgi:hypothetical protein